MPYVDNAGVKIHYHIEGDGPPLVMQHGVTNSIESWYAYGFVEGLKKDYRLIGLIQVQDPFTFFIKMTGPKALVAEHEPAFRRFCESIKIGEH